MLIPLEPAAAASGALTVLCGLVFAFYGIMMGLLIRNENAVSIANGLLVIMSFFGTVFSHEHRPAELRTLHPAVRCRRDCPLPSLQVRPLFWVVRTGSSLSRSGTLLVAWSCGRRSSCVSALLMRRNPPLNVRLNPKVAAACSTTVPTPTAARLYRTRDTAR